MNSTPTSDTATVNDGHQSKRARVDGANTTDLALLGQPTPPSSPLRESISTQSSHSGTSMEESVNPDSSLVSTSDSPFGTPLTQASESPARNRVSFGANSVHIFNMEANVAEANKNNKVNKSEKTKDSKDGLNKIANTYLQLHTASLPQPYGSLCKEIANKMQSLTNDIDQCTISALKLNSADPSTTPRSVNLKIQLKAPDRHREKEEYKMRLAEFQHLCDKFKADATFLFKQNAEEVVKTLKEERFRYLLTKALTLGEVIFAYDKISNPLDNYYQNPNVRREQIATHAVRRFVSTMKDEMISYLGLTKDEMKKILNDDTQTEEFDTNLLANSIVAKKTADTLTSHIENFTVNLKTLLDKTKIDLTINHELQTVITSRNVSQTTVEMEAELEKEEAVSAKNMEQLIGKMVDEKLTKSVKNLTKRMSKNSLGGRKDQPPKPEANGKPSKTSESSAKKGKKNKQAENKKKMSGKDAKKPASNKKNQRKGNQGASNKNGQKQKGKKN